MRIIAGEFRGRLLVGPEGEATRPITDRVKQSVFDIVNPLLPEAVVYDVFAGTGSMGLESLSRGAKRAVFFEADRPALAGLRKNVATLGVAERSVVVAGDLFRWFSEARNRPGVEGRANLVFLDPPYRFLREEPQRLTALAAEIAAHHLAAEGVVVFRHDAGDALDLPPLLRRDERRYGGMVVEFLTA